MKQVMLLIVGSGLCALMATGLLGCGKHLPTQPNHPSTEEYRTIEISPEVTIKMHNSIPDSVNFEIGIDDSAASRVTPMQALASWRDGTRIRYGWDYDGDFYIDYKTPRACCYRVSYTYALHYALQAAGKPLVVYGLSSNADGTITWRIVIGASAIGWMSPASDWFLMWQAKMQYYG